MPQPYFECFSLASRRLSRVIGKIYDEALSDCDLKITQFSVLTAIGFAQKHELPLAGIAKAIDLEQSSITRALGPLIKSGLVELHPGVDRRQRTAKLSPDGLDLLNTATVAWMNAQSQIKELLGDDLSRDGFHVLNAMRDKIQTSHTQ